MKTTKITFLISTLLWLFFPFSTSFSQGTWTDVLWSGDDPIARTECAFVQSGDKFYLVGGRGGNKAVIEFDWTDSTWTEKAGMPGNIHHFQAVELDGLIYIVGAFGGNFPNETPRDEIYIYNPVDDEWTDGPEIPVARRRGSAGAVAHDGKIYIIGGLTNGHTDGWVKWTDVYDPATNTWTQLADAPIERDHFQAVVVGDSIYAIAGRKTGAGATTFDSTIVQVDIYNIQTNSWTTLPASGNIPIGCGGALGVNFNGNVVVMGGEVTDPAALVEVQILDVSAETWSFGTNMHRARHGSQAIVNNSRVYMAAGSRQRGGQLLPTGDSEFMMSGDFSGSLPTGTPNDECDLSSEVGSITFSTVDQGNTENKNDTILSLNGNLGTIVTDINITGGGSSHFSVISPASFPVVIPPNDSLQVVVQFAPTTTGSLSATLNVEHNGSNGTVQIPLSGTGGNPPFPVEIVNFGVMADEGNARISWATASEINNDFFSIERSLDGAMFSSIGEVKGNGTSFEINEYEYIDYQPFAGKSYYRLKQVDFDGSFEFSDVEELNMDVERVELYPNPAKRSEGIFIHLSLNSAREIDFSLTDISGRKVITSSFFAQAGSDFIKVGTPNIPQGIYWAQLISEDEAILQKLIVIQ